jgi:cytochrome subunit of sulfide dehydrogenase
MHGRTMPFIVFQIRSLTLRTLATALMAVPPFAIAADANLGRDVAANCATCHRTDARSASAIPGLIGRDKNELILAMQEFRDGRRPSTVMQQLAKGYTETQIEAAAAYLARQKPQ